MAVALAVVAVGTAIFGAVQQRKASKAQQRQNKVANRIASNKRMRDIRRQIALSRVRRAELESAGFQLGVSGGSSVAGATGALASDTGASIGAANQQLTGQRAITSISDRISGLQSSAATAGAIGGIAGALGQPGTLASFQSLTG